jgi:DNA-binding MarR family transcriptional regulator
MNESIAALTQVLHVAHVLEGRLEQDLAAVGLSLAKVGVLRALAGAREPLTLGGIAESVGCVRSNITQLVDRLEADGLVRRVADADDRRVKRAELTPTGRVACADGVAVVTRHEAAVADALGPEGRALAAALGRLVT